MKKLSALLRVADALDQEHRQELKEMLVFEEAEEVLLRARTEGDFLLEERALKRKGKLFERVFERRLRMVHSGTAPTQS